MDRHLHYSDWCNSIKIGSELWNLQGEIINDSGTMTGGGGKARGGRMRLGNGAPKPLDTAVAAAELAAAVKQEEASLKVLLL